MEQRGRGWLLGGAAALAVAAPTAAHAGYAFHRDHILGASLDMEANATAELDAIAAFAAATDEVLRLDAILSTWRADSELSALNASARFRASPDLFDVIAYGEGMRIATRGAFSPRLGAVTAFARAHAGQAYPAADISRLAHMADKAFVRLDAATRIVEKPAALRFDVDAFAKGHIADRALAAARRASPNLAGFLINLGGDIAAWGDAPGGDAWRVGIAPAGVAADNASAQTVQLRNAAIAYSGRGARDLRFSDGAASHLMSPADGAPARHVSAAVIAPRAMDADALAAAFSVMAPDEALAFADQSSRVAARLVDAHGRVWESAAWADFVAPDAPTMCQAAAPPTPWPTGFSLDVAFEIPRIESGSYEKPYIAIWISDENRRLVRTLLVLGDRARWRESNYVWWRRFERLDPAPVQAMARPTRAPGRYDLTWDGLDNDGQSAGQGRYILNIEASREHGAHSFQSIALDLAAAPLEASAAAQDEIGAASVRYGRAP